MTRNTAIAIGETTVNPGEHVSVSLPVTDLYTGSSLSMPVKVICGKRSGPTLIAVPIVNVRGFLDRCDQSLEFAASSRKPRRCMKPGIGQCVRRNRHCRFDHLGARACERYREPQGQLRHRAAAQEM